MGSTESHVKSATTRPANLAPRPRRARAHLTTRAAADPEQARDLELPSSPLKSGEKRAAKWLELCGSEQTEIDAPATLQPEVLERIAREAVASFFDATLSERVRAAEADWQERADVEIATQIDEDRLDALRVRAEPALDELCEVSAELADMAAGIKDEVPESPDLPAPDMDVVEEAQERRRDAMLIESGMDFAEAVDRLHAHSEMAARRRPKS